MTLSSCPICLRNDTTFLTQYVIPSDRSGDLFKNMSLRLCNNCYAAYADPLPIAMELESYYASIYRSNGKNADLANNRFPLDNLWYLSRGVSIAKLAFRFIHNRNGTLVHADIGAGYGHVIAAFKKLEGWNLRSVAIEPNSYCWSSLGKVADKILKHSMTEAFEKHVEAFDLITLLHVLEHFRDLLKNYVKSEAN